MPASQLCNLFFFKHITLEIRTLIRIKRQLGNLTCLELYSDYRVILYETSFVSLFCFVFGNQQIYTSRQLEWLKGVKTSHGSVAMSSLMETQAINERGVYQVGFLRDDASLAMETLTLDSVIQLTVPTSGNGERKIYTLDSLKDLQSKLMLIAAKACQGKEHVDRYVDVSVCGHYFIPCIIVRLVWFCR